MAKIKAITAREILDSRGTPTIETRVALDGGWFGISSVPSGASVGKQEAVELRDKDPLRYQGQGVLKAVANVNEQIAPLLVGRDPTDQSAIDQAVIDLDGTPQKQVLGANATLSVSQAVCKAAAASQGIEIFSWISQLANQSSPTIPVPIFNVINGGKHGHDNLDFQEFHLIPASYSHFSQGLQMATQIYYQVRQVLTQHQASVAVGDEGGFAPNLFTNLDAFAVINQAVADARFTTGKDFVFGLDAAANHLLSDGRYRLRDKTETLDTDELISFYEAMITQYSFALIEDPLEENDWRGWQKLTTRIGKQVVIVGDDLLVTHKQKLEKAIADRAANGTIVKPNQIGTLTETLEVVALARKSNFRIIVSHRSGETNDSFIADFAVGVRADFTKFGAPARGERVAKYNRLLEIEAQLSNTK